MFNFAIVKLIVMTKNIVISNPSPKMVELFELMKARKQEQLKKLEKRDGAAFKIIV